MKITLSLAIGVMVCGISRGSVAATPPLDRPSPPPCCADGKCFANPLTYGWYETRWRRWPLECEPQVPAGTPTPLPAQLQQEVKPFEPVPPKQEDRRAPPPTVEQAPPTGAPTNAPLGPGGATSPPTTSPPTTRGGPQRTLPPYPPQAPLTTPPTSPLPPPGGQGVNPGVSPLNRVPVTPNPLLNRGVPTGDWDPPPVLPFGPQPVYPAGPVREAREPAPVPSRLPPSMAQPPSNDPPPAPPASLASWEN